MSLKYFSLILLILFNLRTATAQVLMEVPLLLELPGRQELIRAWHDGEVFLVDGKEFFQALQFTVQIRGANFEALDTHHHHIFPCSGLPIDHSCKILLTDVLGRLGTALHFDQKRLHLSASSVASTFDVDVLRERRASWIEAPGPHLFGHTRNFWGGAMVNWQLRRDAFGVHPSLRLTGSALLGTIEADLGNYSAWAYRSDWPRGKWLTQVEIGREANGGAGALITNIPLARQRVQRVRAIRGMSAPYALIQAMISGEVVDQVQADAEGKYQLNVPAWYGTTKLEMYTRPLGGGHILSDSHHLLTPSSLNPPGKMYYQLRVREHEQALNLRYGLRKRLSLHSVLSRTYRRMDMIAGFTMNPVTFLALGAEMHVPFSKWQATLQMWRSGVQVNARIHAQTSQSLNMSITASVNQGPLSLWLRGSHTKVAGHYGYLSLHPEFWLHHPSGLLMQISMEVDRLRGSLVDNRVNHYWRFATGRSLTRGRLLAFADHGYIHQTYGLEGMLALPNKSMTFSMGWDAANQTMIGSLSIHISSALGSFFARGRQDHRGMTHSQQAQGSVHIWRDVKLAAPNRQESAAELQIFEDVNGNGIRDGSEAILPHIEAQLYQGGWRRLKTGALYATNLEPYQRYQVQLIEASVHDPSLHPETGFEFSFTADPGRRKIIQIPMQRLVTVKGKIINMDRAPLRLRVYLDRKKSAEVYRDGGFAFHVNPGDYMLTVMDVLNENVLAEKMIEVDTGPFSVTINLDSE
ncbi:MAG: hypothetical protein OXE92_05340 [Bacteroidetes bacterium]|nr:hypothetical protein [Bacteroidota bacterium]